MCYLINKGGFMIILECGEEIVTDNMKDENYIVVSK